MRQLIAVGILGLVLGGTVLYQKSKIAYQAPPEPETIEKEVVVSDLQKRIEEAQDAALDEIEAAAKSAYQRAYDQAMLEIELEVTSEFRGEIEEREKMLQASSTAY